MTANEFAMYDAIPQLRKRGWIVIEPDENLFDRFAYKPTHNTECIRTSMVGYQIYGGASRSEIRACCMNELGLANGSFNLAWSTLVDAGAVRESTTHPGRYYFHHTDSPEHTDPE